MKNLNKNEINQENNNKIVVGDEIEIEISDLGYNGEGIAKKDGYVLFVPGALPGEKCLVKIQKVNKNFAEANILNIIKKSADRVEPLCPYFSACGGCEMQHIKYEKSLIFKKNFVVNAFKKIAKIDAKVFACEKSDPTFNYRNKIAFCCGKVSGKIGLGMHPKNSHDFMRIESCMLADKKHEKIVKIINDFFEDKKIKSFDFKTQEGLVRHVVLRHLGNKTLICIVINGGSLPFIEDLTEKLIESKESFGLFINENKKGKSEIFGEKFTHIYGLKKIEIEEDGLILSIGMDSFLQVNNYMQNKIYSDVLSKIKQEDTVINAYSGAGFLTGIMAKKCKFAYGIELSKEATQSANTLMSTNNIKNMKNICAKVEDVFAKTIKELKIDSNQNLVVVLDPPRVGVDKTVIEIIAKEAPNRIIYVSCNPSTLARDIALIQEKTKNAYEITFLKPYDMFPQTAHIETLCCLVKK